MALIGVGKAPRGTVNPSGDRGVAVKVDAIDIGTDSGPLFAATEQNNHKKEIIRMSKSTAAKLESAKKWIEKNGQTNSNGKAAQAALSSAEKSVGDTATLRSKLTEAVAAKKAALLSLDQVMLRARTERKLKQKEAKLQAKIAAVSSQG